MTTNCLPVPSTISRRTIRQIDPQTRDEPGRRRQLVRAVTSSLARVADSRTAPSKVSLSEVSLSEHVLSQIEVPHGLHR